MANRATLYIRVRCPDCRYKTVKPAYTSTGRLRPHWAMIDGNPEHHPGSVYTLRYALAGKPTWETIGPDASLALVALQRKNHMLQGLALGEESPVRRGVVTTIEADEPDKPSPAPGRNLLESIAFYMAETQAHKAKKTFTAYSEALLLFLSAADSKHRKSTAVVLDPETNEERKPTIAEYLNNPALLSKAVQRMIIEDITREDMLGYMTFLRESGNQPRTVANRVEYFQIFLHHFGLPSLLKGKDKPKYTEKKVRAYNEAELGLMFQHATLDEADLLLFLLCTGTREQEVQFACWSDVDLISNAHNVTEHRDLGFTPKDKEEGAIPAPENLVDRLIARRKRYPRSRLIFPTKQGKPDGHLLRIFKRLALRAGVNCGHCVNKKGLSCADHPVCFHVILHKMRKTYATRLHKKGVPARKIMSYLRQSDLETTLRYLADCEDDETRAKVNDAFSGFGTAA